MVHDLPHGARLPFVANDELAQDWLKLLSNLGRAERTVDAYGRGLDQYLAFCDRRSVLPKQATLEDVSLFVRWQRGDVVSGVPHAPVANSTLLQRITAIRLYYDHLLYTGVIERNPVPRSDRFRHFTPNRDRAGTGRALVQKVEQLPKIPTDEQWRRLLSVAAGQSLRNRLMFALAYFGALRREELVSLRVPDLDVSRRLVTVRADTTKTGYGRVVSYPRMAGDFLVRYMTERRELDPHPGPLFLSTSNRNRGEPLSKWQWSKTVLSIARSAEVSGFSTHTLRHLRLTHLARVGWRLHEIAIYAGHKNPQSTMTYLHLGGAELAQRIAATIQTKDEVVDAALFDLR